MARTSRGGAPPSSTVDDIDKIDIDDMMMGDDLFEDELLDLGPMGDLNLDNIEDTTTKRPEEEETQEEEKTQEESKTEPEANNKDTTTSEKKENEKVEIPESSSAPVVNELPKRRKTKRKTKSPIILDIDEDVEEEEPKKKRKTKSKNEKKKSNKKQTTTTDDSQTQQEVPSKAKVNKPRTNSMPPPLSRPPAGGAQGHVAAAGQFGGRQKRGHFSLPLARSTSEKLKSKSKASARPSAPIPSTDSTTSAPSAPKAKTRQQPVPSVPPVTSSAPVDASAANRTSSVPATPPVPHTTFCGLLPSTTLFYPFMPALPSEPSLKNRKVYPIMDRLNSTFMSFINTSSNASKPRINGATPVPETDPIYQIMYETLKDVNTSSSSTSSNDQQATEKRMAVANAVGTLRKTVSQLEKSRLTGDLLSVCGLLTRQHDFIKQNLANMKRWCKNNFSEADFAATYDVDASLATAKKKKDVILGKSSTLLGSIVAQSGGIPLLKVKIKCNGFKEPKIGGPLYAILLTPAYHGAVPPVMNSCVSEQPKSSKTSTSKKRKLSAVEATNLAAATPVAPSTKVVQSYVQLEPSKRRKRIAEAVSQTARELEKRYLQGTEERLQALDRRQIELRKLVDDDEVVVNHTAAMWKFIEKSGYFADFTEDTVRDYLRVAWAPEIKEPGTFHRYIAHVARLNDGVPMQQKIARTTTTRKAATDSLFGRLQSLLIEESSDDDDLEDESDDESLFHDGLDEPNTELHCSLPSEHVDVSDLILDERTFLHLRAVGLIENTALPIVDSSKATPTGEGGLSEEDEYSDDMDNVIDAMTADLISLNKLNNSRAAFLESASKSHIVNMKERKRRSVEESSLILKCQQLLKKNAKESKTRNSRPKASVKDEYALPW